MSFKPASAFPFFTLRKALNKIAGKIRGNLSLSLCPYLNQEEGRMSEASGLRDDDRVFTPGLHILKVSTLVYFITDIVGEKEEKSKIR